MRKAVLIVVACGALLFAGCAGDPPHDTGTDPSHDSGTEGHGQDAEAHDTGGGLSAVATIESKNDSGVTGTATFTLSDDQVVLTLSIAGATSGQHAFHLHEIGDCSAPDGTSAGGHWNPTGQNHGRWGTDPFHLGDVANIEIAEDGTGTLTVATNLWSLGTGAANDVVGRSIIVHAGVDDFTTQPTGAAGGRIGCAVIQLVE